MHSNANPLIRNGLLTEVRIGREKRPLRLEPSAVWSRLRGAFVTCIAFRIDAGGNCALASAGHPAPFLNGKEIALPGALPLGLSGTASYEERALRLNVGDHFVLYTDGLLEARSTSGELFGFDRVDALLATGPDASRAAEAAVTFGQDDDITVLTFTRLAVEQESTTQLASPGLSPSSA
jgi:Stage II sporulation protein E (SpoIIE)